MERFKRRFYDSHPELPVDPDFERLHSARPMHTDWTHVVVVAVGAFFGTLARYGVGLLLPSGASDWPVGTFLINIVGAFLLGFLLQSLLRHGKDEGERRIARLTLGTGFLGAFTTYSSLATSTALLVGSNIAAAVTYSLFSVIFGVTMCAFGIVAATRFHWRKRV